jgi:hypothetical protein
MVLLTITQITIAIFASLLVEKMLLNRTAKKALIPVHIRTRRTYNRRHQ